MIADFFNNWPIIDDVLSVLQTLGVIGGLSYLFRYLFRWLKCNYLSDKERKILFTAMKNEHRIIHKPERSSHPLHIKFDFGVKPFPSDDPLEVIKYYEAFLSLIDKGYVIKGSDEIYALTARGIKNSNRKFLLFS